MEKQPGSLESVIESSDMEKQAGYLESVIGVESVFPVESIVGESLTITSFDGFQSIWKPKKQASETQFSRGTSVIARNQRALEKLGMFCLLNGKEEDGKRYKEIRVYLFDQDMYSCDVEFKNIHPRFQFQYGWGDSHRDTFCFVDSTLYIFDGFEPIRSPPGTPRRSARKCVLSQGSKLEKIRDMNHPKWWPVAIPTPDSKKILVFSGALLDKYAKFDFEMYDISKDSWETLPGLPIRRIYQVYRNRLCHSTKSYSFIDETHFLVETTDGTFTLNLQSKKWSHISYWKVDRSWCSGQFTSLLGGRIAVTPVGVYECINHERLIKEVGVKGIRDDLSGDPCGYVFRLSKAQLSKFPPKDPPRSLIPFPSILSLRMGEAKVCTLQAEEEDDTDGARVLIDISRVDFKTHKMKVVDTIRAHIHKLSGLQILQLFPL